MVLGCIAGVIAGAAPSTETVGGLPINWTLAAVSAVLLLLAFALRLRSGRGEAVRVESAGSIEAARAAVDRTPADVEGLLSRAAHLPIRELAAELQRLIEFDLKPVLDAQSALVRSQGFAQYAAHTGPWASGERMIYRAWSAATDGHRPEAVASLVESLPHFVEAARAFGSSPARSA